jgi:dsDNA-specific endonuclease/ATPase MutS2
MWRLLEYLLIAAIVLMAITEFFYPLLAGKPLFGSFRKKTNEAPKSLPNKDDNLDEKIDKAKEKVEEIKSVQKEVDKHYKSAEQLKEEADKLLHKNDNTN